MKLNADHIRDRFCVAGISYRKADTTVRGLYAVDNDLHHQILREAHTLGIRSLFVLSTCNRTEIYGYCSHPEILARLLTDFTRGSYEEFLNHGFLAHGNPAMHHLFRVAAGLDSQIIGDYEIQGQLKTAIAIAREEHMIGPIMDRTINYVFQASKKIRTNTKLSTGTVSVSFAAMEWLHEHVGDTPHKALLIGAGKFGSTVCRSLQHYLPACELTVCNRTYSTAQKLADNLGVACIPFESLAENISHFDVIVVSTASQEPIVLRNHFTTEQQRFVVDLSIPSNVEIGVKDLPGMHLANVDDISAILERNIEIRRSEVPLAEEIISDFEQEFYAWLHTYKHTPAIRHMKQQLLEIGKSGKALLSVNESECPSDVEVEKIVQETVNGLVLNLKSSAAKGCHVIEAYHQFFNQMVLTAQSV